MATKKTGNKVGRPPKKALEANTPGKMPKRGRPPGEAAAMAEFKARILTSPKSTKVIEKILDAALDDDHKGQTAAWKLLLDRMIPVSQFEKGASGKSAVTINITGLGETSGVTIDAEEAEEATYTDDDALMG